MRTWFPQFHCRNDHENQTVVFWFSSDGYRIELVHHENQCHLFVVQHQHNEWANIYECKWEATNILSGVDFVQTQIIDDEQGIYTLLTGKML